MFQELKNKKVLFITTKNLDYLRNTQELRLLREQAAQVSVIGVKDKSYPLRLIKVFFKLLFTSCKKYDKIFFISGRIGLFILVGLPGSELG